MPCVSCMSLSFTRQKINEKIKHHNIKISTSTNETVNANIPTYYVESEKFRIPHRSSKPEKYVYMPGAVDKAVVASAIPGYNARQAEIGPVVEMVRAAQANMAKYGTYGVKTMESQPVLSKRELKKQLRAERKLEKAALKARRKHSRISRGDLINAESRLGSTIFGPVPEGHRREFFHDQQNVWIWYEGWLDDYARAHQFTVRYEVRPSGVYKKLSAGKYVQLKGEELDNFRQAARTYLDLIKRQLYVGV